jgi:predicted ribosomally synthesized peptide with SipW-like signal peptide
MFATLPVKKGIALAASVALLGCAAWLAAGSTGAYFSDTHTGTISGTVGSIKVTPYGGSGASGTDLAFSNLLPGAAQTATLSYQNTGRNTEDIYVVFNNPMALSALNSLGTYGEVHLAADGNPLFDSANLNDRLATCGPFAPSGCWPLKSSYLVRAGVAPGESGTVSFSFAYASKLSTQASGSVVPPWNSYPVAGQVTTVPGAAGTGLPYQIVATQPGITPGS